MAAHVALEPRPELRLGDLAALEHEQRVVAVLSAARAIAVPSSSSDTPDLLLVGEEPLLERRREHAAEVAYEYVPHAAAGGSMRSISS